MPATAITTTIPQATIHPKVKTPSTPIKVAPKALPKSKGITPYIGKVLMSTNMAVPMDTKFVAYLHILDQTVIAFKELLKCKNVKFVRTLGEDFLSFQVYCEINGTDVDLLYTEIDLDGSGVRVGLDDESLVEVSEPEDLQEEITMACSDTTHGTHDMLLLSKTLLTYSDIKR